MSIPRIAVCLLAGIPLLSATAVAQDYVAVGSSGVLVGIDAQTGCQTGSLPAIYGAAQINAMARRPSDGMLFFAGAWSAGVIPTLYQVDPANGYATGPSIPLTGLPVISIRGMAFDPSGVLFATNFASPYGELITIDETTGVCTLVGTMGWGIAVQALAWDEASGHLVGWDPGTAPSPPGPGLIHINPWNGSVVDPSLVDQCIDPNEVQGLTFDRDGKLISVGHAWWVQELNPATGQVLWTGSCQLTNYSLRGVEDVRPRTLQMTLEGSCPGQMQVKLRDGTANGQAAVAYSLGNNGFLVPPGRQCAGTLVQLSAPVTLLGIYGLDAQGAFTSGPLFVPANACGSVWVQAIDLVTCDQTAALQP